MNERAEYWHKKMQERLKKMNPTQRYNYEMSKKIWVEFYRRMNKEYLSSDEIQKYIDKSKEYKYWKGNGKMLVEKKKVKKWKELLREKLKQMEREKAMGDYFYFTEEEIEEGMNK